MKVKPGDYVRIVKAHWDIDEPLINRVGLAICWRKRSNKGKALVIKLRNKVKGFRDRVVFYPDEVEKITKEEYDEE